MPSSWDEHVPHDVSNGLRLYAQLVSGNHVLTTADVEKCIKAANDIVSVRRGGGR